MRRLPPPKRPDTAMPLDNTALADASQPGSGNSTSPREWLSVCAVAISAFAFVTTEFLPVGLLPHIATDFHVSTGAAGLMVTIPGILAALAAPGAVLAAGRMNRRYVFLLLTACLLASNVIGALAPNLPVMLAGRALLGAALGGFWTLATAASTRLVAPRDVARAMAVILAGVTCATVIGVPIGTYIADVASWRAAFACTGALVTLALIGQYFLVPSLPSHTAMRMRDLIRPLSEPHVRRALIMITLLFGAHFCSYTYISPFLIDHAHFAMSSVTWLLLGFGALGFLSNIAFSRGVDHDLKRSMTIVVALLLCAQLALPLFVHSQIVVTGMLMVWGIAFGGVPLCSSVLMQRATPRNAEAGSALFVCGVQIAIAVASLAGGAVVDHIGVPADMLMGAVIALLSLLVWVRPAVIAIRGKQHA